MVKHYPRQDKTLRGKLRVIARQMRREPTPAEDFLWQRLRARQLCGHRFHRQHSIGRFIVDFVCPQAALAIEVDGDVHRRQVEADQEREQVLKDLGFRVIRFTNAQVLEQTDQVLQQIHDALVGTSSPKSSFGGFGEEARRSRVGVMRIPISSTRRGSILSGKEARYQITPSARNRWYNRPLLFSHHKFNDLVSLNPWTCPPIFSNPS